MIELVSYIDRQVDEWCYHADIIAMCKVGLHGELLLALQLKRPQ